MLSCARRASRSTSMSCHACSQSNARSLALFHKNFQWSRSAARASTASARRLPRWSDGCPFERIASTRAEISGFVMPPFYSQMDQNAPVWVKKG